MKATARKIKDNEWIAEFWTQYNEHGKVKGSYPIVSTSDIEWLENNNMDGKEVEGNVEKTYLMSFEYFKLKIPEKISTIQAAKNLQEYINSVTPPIHSDPGGDPVRNFDIDVLLGWIANRIELDELSEEMNQAVKAHKFEEASIIRDKRNEVGETLNELRITVGELLDKYQYYFKHSTAKP